MSQQPIPVVYENIRIDTGFRADLVVEDKVIVEIKSVELIAPVHKKQHLTYLRLADKRLGLLINFQIISSDVGANATPVPSLVLTRNWPLLLAFLARNVL